MMVAKENLGLSLSLNFPENMAAASNSSSLHHLNLMPASNNIQSPSPYSVINKTSWTKIFPSADRSPDTCRGDTMSFLKGIDVNRFPEADAADDEAGVSSPNSTLSSLTGKRTDREHTGISDEEDAENARKKLRLSKDQSSILEESFKEHSTLNPKQKIGLAKRLGLRPRQVEVWFQNRRARTKLKQTEIDCEFLKRCYDNLTDENRRLQKEVQQLRALKVSPQFYMQMTPPTTLTMCPSCERLAMPPPVDGGRPIQMALAQSRSITFNAWC